MSEAFDLTTVIFLGLAVFVFFRLRAVLGQRSGHESPGEPIFRESTSPDGKKMPQRHPEQPPLLDMAPVAGRWPDIAPDGSLLAEGLAAIARADHSFDPRAFCAGAKAAYEMIVNAFNVGDRKALKGLLSSEVFDSFAKAISEREQRGEKVEANFVSVDKAQLISAALKASEAQLGVRFESKLISATRNKDGLVVEGNPDQVTEVTDLWTFSRDTLSRDPNWRLTATEDA